MCLNEGTRQRWHLGGISALLTGWIGGATYVSLEVLHWPERMVKWIVIGTSLGLAWVLFRNFDRAYGSGGGASWRPADAKPGAPVPLTEAQQEYADDPDARAACRHLLPIEGAMRRAGLTLRLLSETALSADCRIHEDALGQSGLLVVPARYSASRDERGIRATLWCSECGYMIHTRHPDLGGDWFPAQPAT